MRSVYRGILRNLTLLFPAAAARWLQQTPNSCFLFWCLVVYEFKPAHHLIATDHLQHGRKSSSFQPRSREPSRRAFLVCTYTPHHTVLCSCIVHFTHYFDFCSFARDAISRSNNVINRILLDQRASDDEETSDVRFLIILFSLLLCFRMPVPLVLLVDCSKLTSLYRRSSRPMKETMAMHATLLTRRKG